MTDPLASLLAASFPAVVIEKWRSVNGWDDCLHVYVVTRTTRIRLCNPPHDEFVTFDEAHAAAVDYVGDRDVPIFDLREIEA